MPPKYEKSGDSPQLLNPFARKASRPEPPMRRYLRTSTSTVLYSSVSPIFGAISNDSRIVLPDSGPNSRNTVVSCTNATPSGADVPLRNSCVP